jgi:four helix bundle protein
VDADIKKKSRELAAKFVTVSKSLQNHKKETVLSGEMLRAACGIGANLAKADVALNANERALKVYAAIQSCAEAKYWLEVLNDNEYLTEFEFNDSLKACDEMGKELIGLLKEMRSTPASQPQKPPTH